MPNPKTKRLAYNVERIADREKLNAKRYPLNAKKHLIICVLLFGITCNTYALNLEQFKVYFLKGDYKSAISEGEKIMANSKPSSSNLDKLYFILGLSYLKEENYLRASDIFEIILREFKDSRFIEEAKIGLADTYFLRGDFSKAQDYYQELIKTHPQTKFNALVFYRLSQVGFRRQAPQIAAEYLYKLRQDFPLNPELIQNKDLSSFSDSSSGLYYTVQVGAFTNIINAKNLTERLIQKGYPAYIEELHSQGGQSYRVRVGKLRLLQEAKDLEDKLIQEGYPTKIYP